MLGSHQTLRDRRFGNRAQPSSQASHSEGEVPRCTRSPTIRTLIDVFASLLEKMCPTRVRIALESRLSGSRAEIELCGSKT